MKKIDMLDVINNELSELRDKIGNSTSIAEVEELITRVDELKLEKNKLEIGDTSTMTTTQTYLETNAAVNDFAEIFVNSKSTDSALAAWKEKLKTNGLTIDDDAGYLPKKLELAIQTVLTRANPVFPLFKTTNQGAILFTRELTSDDEAKVHVPGTQKDVQVATLKTSGVKPKMIYKMQSINEIDKRTINNFGELYETIVEELAQRVIDKIVDLALVEGSATDGDTGGATKENGFISILNEQDTNKVVHVNGSTDLVEAVEEAVDAIDAAGKKYLIVTKQQKRAILKALRLKFPQSAFKANNAEIASEFGVDEIVIYNGSKAIKPTVMVEGSYAVDMQPLTRVEQFKIDKNTNDILVETVASGRPVVFGGIAVIDLPEQ